MKQVVINSCYRTKNVFSTGFISITDNVIEGCFTSNYMRIILHDKKMDVILIHNNIWSRSDDKLEIYTFSKSYDEKTLFVPEEYVLYNKNLGELHLSLHEVIKDEQLISAALKSIDSVRG